MRVEVEGRVGRGSLAVCEELVSNSRRRGSVEPTGGQACGRAQGGGAGVLVAHVALAGMLDLFYLRVATQLQNMSTFILECKLLCPALQCSKRLLFNYLLSSGAIISHQSII